MDIFTWAQYHTMWNEIKEWKAQHGRYPNYIDIYGVRVTEAQYMDMYDRVVAYIQKNNTIPSVVGVQGPAADTDPKSPFRKSVEVAAGIYDNVTGFIQRLIVKGEDWVSYRNDMFTLAQEIERVKGKLPMNCSDLTQLLYYVSKDLGGYNVHFIHLICPESHEGHIVLEISGREFKEKVWIDLSAMLHNNYAMGKGWCYRWVDDKQSFSSRDDPWLKSDDGKT